MKKPVWIWIIVLVLVLVLGCTQAFEPPPADDSNNPSDENSPFDDLNDADENDSDDFSDLNFPDLNDDDWDLNDLDLNTGDSDDNSLDNNSMDDNEPVEPPSFESNYTPSSEDGTLKPSNTREFIVILNADGFTPDLLKIKKSESVIIKLVNGDVKHDFYLEAFDVQKPVEPDRITLVSFVASKTGTFSFHCEFQCQDTATGQIRITN